jgi:hypothetical protein
MKRTALYAALLLTLASTALFAQTIVAPPPQPAGVVATANAEILTLLQAQMPESVVLDKIHAATDKFDTSAASLVELKKAGASEAELKAVLAQGIPTTPAQNDVKQQPANSQPANGPSLEETMQFIKNQLVANSAINFVTFRQNTNDGTTINNTFNVYLSDIHVDTAACRINYHYKTLGDGKVRNDYDQSLILGETKDLLIDTEDKGLIQLYARTGHPEISVTTNPSIVDLTVRRKNSSKTDVFRFMDNNIADRVATAFTHAIELCGGGEKSPY